MNDILRELINEGHVVVYLDDILIFTDSLEEHRRITRRVLEILQKHKLYLKPEKCEFECTEIEYLGVIISHNSMEMDPVKIKGVMEWPEPKTVKQVQAFLGFTNFYRRFIRGYSDVAKPLTRLTGKTGWSWGDEQRAAFKGLKARIAEDAVLALPTDDGKFRLEADASEGVIGAVISQEQEGVWRPVAFMSHSLSETERNYEIYDKEMLAIMKALEEYRAILMGAQETFEILTDHQNLEYFKKPQKLNRRQARWVTELSQYNFTLHHRPGALNRKADLLSRRSDHDQGKDDNKDVILLKPELFRMTQVHFKAPSDELLDQIKSTKRLDTSVKLALEKSLPDWKRDGDLILYREKVYVPRDEKLRERIIRLHHDTPLVGHPGEYRTQELVERNYWWPRMGNQIKEYVRTCDACQRTRWRRRTHGLLHPHSVPQGPWEVVSMDLIGPLPESNGFTAIQVWVDLFTKRIHVEPVDIRINSEGVARLTRDRVIRYHGVPRKIISDRDPRYVSGFMRELNRLLGTEMNPSTAYHPETDGQTERMNQEIEHYLRIYVNFHQSDWSEWLSLAEFAYNDKVNASTKASPFFLDHGYHPWKGVEGQYQSNNPTAEEFAEAMKRVREEAGVAIKKAQERMKRYHDKKRVPAPEFKPGDKVLVSAKRLEQNRPSDKLADRQVGPYEVVKKVGASAYELRMPGSSLAHPVHNEKDLEPYHEPPLHRREGRPVAEIIKGQEEWEVEEILKKRKRGRGWQYLIKWKGYPNSENTWEAASRLTHAKRLLNEFNWRNP